MPPHCPLERVALVSAGVNIGVAYGRAGYTQRKKLRDILGLEAVVESRRVRPGTAIRAFSLALSSALRLYVENTGCGPGPLGLGSHFHRCRRWNTMHLRRVP
jgi:hypothetical protein